MKLLKKLLWGLFFLVILPLVSAQSHVDMGESLFKVFGWIFVDLSQRMGEPIYFFWIKLLLFILLFSLYYLGTWYAFKEKQKKISTTVALILALMSSMLIPEALLTRIMDSYTVVASVVVIGIPIVAIFMINQFVLKGDNPGYNGVRAILYMLAGFIFGNIASFEEHFNFEFFSAWAGFAEAMCLVAAIYNMIKVILGTGINPSSGYFGSLKPSSWDSIFSRPSTSSTPVQRSGFGSIPSLDIPGPVTFPPAPPNSQSSGGNHNRTPQPSPHAPRQPSSKQQYMSGTHLLQQGIPPSLHSPGTPVHTPGHGIHFGPGISGNSSGGGLPNHKSNPTDLDRRTYEPSAENMSEVEREFKESQWIQKALRDMKLAEDRLEVLLARDEKDLHHILDLLKKLIGLINLFKNLKHHNIKHSEEVLEKIIRLLYNIIFFVDDFDKISVLVEKYEEIIKTVEKGYMATIGKDYSELLHMQSLRRTNLNEIMERLNEVNNQFKEYSFKMIKVLEETGYERKTFDQVRVFIHNKLTEWYKFLNGRGIIYGGNNKVLVDVSKLNTNETDKFIDKLFATIKILYDAIESEIHILEKMDNIIDNATLAKLDYLLYKRNSLLFDLEKKAKIIE